MCLFSVSLCHEKLKVPVTAKIRIFSDVERTVRYAKMLEDAGCQVRISSPLHDRRSRENLGTPLLKLPTPKSVQVKLNTRSLWRLFGIGKFDVCQTPPFF